MLRFDLLGIPVGVHWSFLLVALFFSGQFSGVALLGVTTGVFLAVLLHELAHALTARAYGSAPEVTLFALGGVTRWVPRQGLSHWGRFSIAAAGSAAGIAVGGALWYLDRQGAFIGSPTYIRALVVGFWFAGLFWGVLNWIPIRMLDGGHMVEAALRRWVPERADRLATGISLVSGVGAALVAWRFDYTFAALFAVLFVLQDLSSLRARPQAAPKPQDRGLADRDASSAAGDTTPADPAQKPEFPI